MIERTGWLFRKLDATPAAAGKGPGGIDLAARAAADCAAILTYIQPSTDYRREELEGACGVPRARARTALATLERSGRLVRIKGAGKHGHRQPEFLRLAPAQEALA